MSSFLLDILSRSQPKFRSLDLPHPDKSPGCSSLERAETQDNSGISSLANMELSYISKMFLVQVELKLSLIIIIPAQAKKKQWFGYYFIARPIFLQTS